MGCLICLCDLCLRQTEIDICINQTSQFLMHMFYPLSFLTIPTLYIYLSAYVPHTRQSTEYGIKPSDKRYMEGFNSNQFPLIFCVRKCQNDYLKSHNMTIEVKNDGSICNGFIFLISSSAARLLESFSNKYLTEI